MGDWLVRNQICTFLFCAKRLKNPVSQFLGTLKLHLPHSQVEVIPPSVRVSSFHPPLTNKLFSWGVFSSVGLLFIPVSTQISKKTMFENYPVPRIQGCLQRNVKD